MARGIARPWPTTRSTGISTPVYSQVTIAYAYDGLYRLTEAVYSTGDEFQYAYDAVGNTLTRTQTLAGVRVVTTYAYDAANQLTTAQSDNDPTVWYYAYDNNGSLTEVLPNNALGAGARRYTYNASRQLVQAERHDGVAYQPQAEMEYNGLGGRVAMTAWQAALSISTQYALDVTRHGQVLAATASSATTVYLYGKAGPLAELTTSWAYHLKDGLTTPRQMTDAAGDVTLARSYTPWGEVREQNGAGNINVTLVMVAQRT